MDNAQIALDSAQSAVRVAVSMALGCALITGIDECEQEGTALTQNQRVYLATMSIMAYNVALDAVDLLKFESTDTVFLNRLRSREPREVDHEV